MSPHRDDDPSALFGRDGRPRRRPGGPSGDSAARGPRDHRVDDHTSDDLDDFHPPNPRNPLAGARPGVVLGVTMFVGSLVVLLLLIWLPLTLPGFVGPGLVGLALVGLVVLFLQMPQNRTGGGDGAQV
ncbi:MAG: hypothetical protein Q4F53_08155 [Nesterenkonia sp.]|uniref:hypothetical protein n=1 Tax=Nesterenkonia marinintestina TaxID=2979865 RepID=UPI0021C0B580|nr:hypothetical protein [Nesterenkonia sp. GX14115]MDO5493565.1 hypothetical protein [Nesterenkonia sp.]